METTELLQSLHIPFAELERICKKYYICKLSLFGSVLHGEARPDSDLDILVEFVPGHIPGFAFAGIQDELSQVLHRTVDLHTSGSLSKYFRDEVLAEAVTIYAEDQA